MKQAEVRAKSYDELAYDILIHFELVRLELSSFELSQLYTRRLAVQSTCWVI